MTVKRQKTLHRFAAVAAVLLAFCLVFMMPAAAELTGEGTQSKPYIASTFSELTAVSFPDSGTVYVTLGDSFTGTATWTIPEGKSVVLDLAGKTITATDSSTVSWALIQLNPGSEFTLIDTGTDGKITLEATTDRKWNAYSSVISVQRATAIINGGTLEHLGGTAMAYGIDVLTNGDTNDENARLTVNGGEIKSTYIAVRGFANSNSNTVYITISGGSLESPATGIWIQQPDNKVCPYYLKITDGEVFGKNQALYYDVCNVATSDVLRLTEITGGVIRNNNDNSDDPTRNPPRAAIRYDLGTHSVNGEYEYYVTSMANHQLKITGGEVKNDAEGSTIVYNSDSTVAPTLTGAEISELDSVSSDDFIGKFSIPAFGMSYVWAVNDEEVVGETTNELTHTFSSVAGTTQKVSVTVTCSEQCEYTYTKSVSVPETYTVSFVANEGEGTMNPAYAYSDNKVIVLPDCTFTAPEGKTFKAWQIGNTEYAADVSYTVTADTSVTAVWKEVGAAVAPSLGDDVADVNDDGTTEINTSADNVEPDEINNKVTITDQSTGVKIDVQYDDDVSFDDGTASGNVDKITVTYPENQVAASADADSTEEVITQTVSFQLDTLTTVLPKIESVFKEEEAQKITEKLEFKDHKPFAMITATNADSVNNNMTSEGSYVTVEFRVPKTLVDKLVNGNLDLLRGYHITIEDGKEVVKEIEISTPVLDGDDYIIKLTGNGFSSYVLGYEEPKTNIGNNGGGSATDTGSGNYQYYPRSVPTDGIVDFGTSKVVTGMELPAGSDGTVTLNIKPTFAMPENGFYAFEIDAPGYNTDAKINGGLSFQIPVADLEAAGWTAEDIVLFHGTVGEDGKITWEALPTNLVKNENGVAYYKAAINSCSPFYIGFVKDGSVVNTEVVDPVTPETPETPVTPDEPEVLPPVDEPETPEQPTESPAPILAVLAGLGAAVVLRRK